MSEHTIQPPINKKKLLADPVAFFYKYQNKHNNIDEVRRLSKQRLTQQQQQQTLQFKSKKLSRKIGDAKRNNQSIDDLKERMQALSKELKKLAQQLMETENQLLSYLHTPTTHTDKTATQTPENPYGKRNYASHVDIDKISIKPFDNNHQAWNDYVNKNSAGCIHHRSEWAQLLYETYRHRCFYFAAYDQNNKIVGILSLVQLNSRLFGNLLISMPYFQRAGALADHPLIEQALMQHTNQLAKTLDIDHIEYRDDIEHKDLPVQTHKANLVLALPKNSDTLWQSFSSKLRSQIKRAQREKTETFIGRKELLNEFYAVYSRNMRDLGSPVHSKNFIANILEQFPENSHLIIIKLKQKTVSAALLLSHNKTMEIPLASTIRNVNHLSINMLLYWEVLQFSIKNKNNFFDFGRSSKGAGTYKFKQQWGALPQTLYWHYWLKNDNDLPELNPSNPKYALLIFVWKHLPLALANFLGPKIVKNIP